MKNIFLTLVAISVILFGCTSKKRNNTTQNDTQQNQIAVKTTKLKPQVFNHFIETSGTVDAIDFAIISPQASGQVAEVLVNDGDHVTKGQTLVKLNDDIIKNNIAELQAQLDLAKITYEKQKQLYDQKIISEIAYLQAKTQVEALQKRLAVLNKQLSFTAVTAPFSGIAENIQIKVGEIAAPGRQLMQLVNLKNLKIIADLSEKYISKIHKGDSVQVNFESLSLDKMNIPIFRIGNIINPNNRTFQIELRLKNTKDNQIKPNMVASLKIKDYSNNSVIVIPTIVVQKDFDKEFVFTAYRKGNKWFAKKTYITTGLNYKGKTEVLSGLNFGDLLISEGYNEVANNVEIKIIK